MKREEAQENKKTMCDVCVMCVCVFVFILRNTKSFNLISHILLNVVGIIVHKQKKIRIIQWLEPKVNQTKNKAIKHTLKHLKL